ncbi:unnamed protein product [Agarophyton chilense]
MRCPSCDNDTLSPTGDGALVCDACGEQVVGFQEEQVDFALTGTAVTNRQSQSSQALAVRQSIEFRKQQPAAPQQAAPTDDLLICEGVFILAKAIALRLIHLRYCSDHVMRPLFQIISCWVHRRHAGAHKFGKSHTQFQQYHVLSLVSLACLYVRAPMLPRDLCRLVNTRQIPFFAVLKTVFPASFRKTPAVRSAFTPNKMPIAKHVIRVANELATDNYAWPSLAKFFQANHSERAKTASGYVWGSKHTFVPTSFPVAHLHITLLRLSRLLGLPDEFGARVLRFIDLRLVAVKMARVLNHQKHGPWDDSDIDAYKVDHIPNYLDPTRPFSKVIQPERDLYGFPTDHAVQADFINTMRLCYGRRKFRPNAKPEEPSQRDQELREEWERCMDAMLRWLQIGTPEDLDNVAWTSLSPDAILNTRGRALRKLARFVEDIHDDKGEEDPELWGPFIKAFREIGERGAEEDQVDFEENEPHIVDETHCMYDVDRICPGLSEFVDAKVRDMKVERQVLDSVDLRDADGETVNREPVRRWELRRPPRPKPLGNRKRLYSKVVSSYDYYYEPAGIGLAWTIMNRFFAGSNVMLEGMKVSESVDIHDDQMRRACDRTMGAVVRYILGLKAMQKPDEDLAD